MHTCVQLRQHRVTGTTSFKFLKVMVGGPDGFRCHQRWLVGKSSKWMWVKIEDLGDHRC